MFYQLRQAEEKDVKSLQDFMKRAGVRTDGVEEIVDQFVLMEADEQQLVGCLGFEEIQDDNGLLRSLVVSDQLSQAHILSLFKSIQSIGKSKAIKKLYLIANKQSSVDFLQFIGFQPAESIPDEVSSHEHARESLQKDGATVMVLA
ncbi:GNAT family N-acetyltransferase [Metabacillus arenae]|uniref:Uncharacterized protein n=1 Tax=Metabacillus arenae TaxID=2771434 RepID=A0A926NHB1_9BACI|nr:hypothetical protein [Metabacillus arenae]MBD1383459.1 hypothetical protein [Metabacillus arenae]